MTLLLGYCKRPHTNEEIILTYKPWIILIFSQYEILNMFPQVEAHQLSNLTLMCQKPIGHLQS